MLDQISRKKQYAKNPKLNAHVSDRECMRDTLE
jgi:hypothetical protein